MSETKPVGRLTGRELYDMYREAHKNHTKRFYLEAATWDDIKDFGERPVWDTLAERLNAQIQKAFDEGKEMAEPEIPHMAGLSNY